MKWLKEAPHVNEAKSQTCFSELLVDGIIEADILGLPEQLSDCKSTGLIAGSVGKVRDACS